VLKVYNKVQTDFDDLLEYNNYLEEVEDLIFAIVNEEPNAEECIAKYRKYEEENKNAIVARQSQRADEDRTIEARIAAEQRDAERRKRDLIEGEKAVAAAKRRYKQEATQVSLGVSTNTRSQLALFEFSLVVTFQKSPNS
jgi:CDK-activating kinase assembly factor MAT1